MAVPNSISDLDAVAANNSPAGSDSIGTSLDDYLRSHAAIIKQQAANTQIGISSTASENHFFYGATANQLTLKKGTASSPGVDVMTVSAAGKVAFPQNAQTWQDFSSNTTGTSYTNNTGLPIQVSVYMTSNINALQSLKLTVSSVDVAYQYMPGLAGTATVICVTGIVPIGATYSVTASGGVSWVWKELR